MSVIDVADWAPNVVIDQLGSGYGATLAASVRGLGYGDFKGTTQVSTTCRTSTEASRSRNSNEVARLREGATPSDAETELAVITARVAPLSAVSNAAGERILSPLLATAALVLPLAPAGQLLVRTAGF